MMAGGNAKAIVTKIKARVEQINSKGMLPDGLKIVPYYDRSELVDAAMHTVTKVLMEGIVLVVIVLFLFLGDVRSSVIVVATLVLTPLLTFICMNYLGISANLMSLGGLAIAIGLMVDGSVVVVENAFLLLGRARNRREQGPHHPARRGRGGNAGDLWRGHHHPRLPAADDAAGHGGQDVCASGLYHRHCAGDFAGAVADADAGAVVLSAQGARPMAMAMATKRTTTPASSR
jgi:hypothetical protein